MRRPAELGGIEKEQILGRRVRRAGQWDLDPSLGVGRAVYRHRLEKWRADEVDDIVPDHGRDAGAGRGVISTLYAFSADTPATSKCTGRCARLWPPVLAQSAPVAALMANGSLLDCTDEQWALSFDLNVTSMFRLIRAVLPQMLARRRGSIINMSSVASSIKGVVNRCAYGATKAAVIGLTKSVAADFVTSGVRCNAICPGTVDTPSLHQRLEASGDYGANLRAFIDRQPMGRLGKPDEIAALALYLASDESQFTTGQCHIIDGGWSN